MKSGNKNSKENEALRLALEELQVKSKQHREMSVNLQSLQNRNATLVIENGRVTKEFEALKEETDSLINNLKFHIEILEDRNRTILIQKRDEEIKHDALRVNFESATVDFEIGKASRELEIEQLKKRIQENTKHFQNQQNSYQHAISEHSKLLKEISDLKQTRDEDRGSYKSKLADIERDKIQSIDSIKKEMVNKACQMRNKALQIRKQQFKTTTRLTFLQNDQLIRELEYQSSKTETILKRNTELEKEVKELKRCIEIHQGVQKEIMKRNVIAKNAISTLTTQIQAISGKDKKQKDSNSFYQPKESSLVSNKNIKTSKNITEEVNESNQKVVDDSSGESIAVFKTYIDQLQKVNLQIKEENNKLKKEFEEAKREASILKNKVGSVGCNNVAQLLVRFLQQVVKPVQAENNEAEDEDLDLEAMREVDIEKWSVSCIDKVTKMLLNSLRPHLTLKVLKLPYFQAVTNNSKNRSSSFDYESMKQNFSGSKYVEALKRQRNKSIEKIKEAPQAYVIGEERLNKNLFNYRKLSGHKLSSGQGHGLEPVAKRFLKSHLANKTIRS